MQLLELHLLTPDLNATKAFYTHNLGFVTQEDAPDKLVLKAGYTTLVFSPANGANARYHFAFNIPSNQIEEAFHYMQQRVAALPLESGQLIADFVNWNAKAFYFLDNNQNVVEFIARFDLKENCTGPFTPRVVLGVSEIGLVTDNVALACRQLEELWQVPLFTRQQPTGHFAAVGNDEGLFIVVAENRHWYPTQIPAVKSAMKAVFKAHDESVRVLEVD